MVGAFERMWDRIAAPGATLTGAERISIASIARAARSGDPLPAVDLPAMVVEAARVLGAEPASINKKWIAETIEPAIGYPGYVEIVGLVSQLTAVDTYHRAMGLPLEPLPEPIAGEPTGAVAEGAKLTSSWVPTDGPGSVVYALSLVPSEKDGFEDLHGPLYLPVGEIRNWDFSRALARPQMELVAARTSAINDCFY
jgi:hypothetical protein